MTSAVTSAISNALTTVPETTLSPEQERYLDYIDYTVMRGELGRLVDTGKIESWVWFLALIGIAVLAYLFGSLNFAVIISKLKFKDDIRKHGSGNAGATNMSRTYGKAIGILTLLCDILKTIVPVFLAKILLGEMIGYGVALMCALGHAFPCYYKFKGGKCVAVTAASALIMNPLMFLILLVVFVATVAFTKYVSVGSVFAALIYPVILQNVYGFAHPGLVFVIANSLLVIFLHRQNIKRLLDGKENKFVFKNGEKKDKPAEK